MKMPSQSLNWPSNKWRESGREGEGGGGGEEVVVHRAKIKVTEN